MGQVRLYLATSLDGFIADGEGSVDWLEPYNARLYGYEKFLSEVGALIMGRRTFEVIKALGDWPYRGMPVFVLSSQYLGRVPKGVTGTTRGMLGALQQARLASPKDIWLVGGAVAMQSALEEGYVDLVEIFLVPVMLGSGLSVLNDLRRHQQLVLEASESYPDGVVKLRYQVRRPQGGAAPA